MSIFNFGKKKELTVSEADDKAYFSLLHSQKFRTAHDVLKFIVETPKGKGAIAQVAFEHRNALILLSENAEVLKDQLGPSVRNLPEEEFLELQNCLQQMKERLFG